MSPRSLLFSSDEDTSRSLVQALRELELEIEPCADIFTAIEWLTSRSFDVIVADWDSGPEASFLLKNARELKLNKAAFSLALTSGTHDPANKVDSPDLVLTKPLTPDDIKYALLSNDRFLGCMRAWIARGDFAQAPEATPSWVSLETTNIEHRRPQFEQPSPMPPAVRPDRPSPSPGYNGGNTRTPLHLTFATLDRRLFRSLNQQNGGEYGFGWVRRYTRNKFLWGTTFIMVFVSVGCIFGQPMRIQSVFRNVATVYRQGWEMKSRKPKSSENATRPDSTGMARAATSQPKYLASRGRTFPVLPILLPDQISQPPVETLPVDSGLDPILPPATISRAVIPDSLKVTPTEAATIRTASPRRSPSLLSQLEPVSLSESLSQALLLDKVPPSYPDQALKAGLQGVVVLQAWIGKDGSIRDLKLVDGSLLLGKAAVKAVKQWRYRPYLRNGVAMEAETYVTVNFRLP